MPSTAVTAAVGEPVICPFRVVIDQREKAPFSFTGLRTDSDRKHRPLVVYTEQAFLPTGDYMLNEFTKPIVIERKSKEDLFGSLGQHRERFRREHERMAEIVAAGGYAAVVIEADWGELMHSPPPGSRLLPKVVLRTAGSWSMRYGVHYWAMAGRRFAELWTFRLLELHWKHEQEKLKKG